MLIDLVTLQPVHYSWRGYDEISPALPHAVIGAEDQNFCSHHGFDWKGIDKAMQEHKRHPDKPLRGASTISQQTARTLFLVSTRSWIRKGVEAYLTVLIEGLWPRSASSPLISTWWIGATAITVPRPHLKPISKPTPRISRARRRRVWPRFCQTQTTGARTIRTLRCRPLQTPARTGNERCR
ncbi:MAG: transglycosylase domain-containing protein [Rhizomicrobium sp.]